MFGELGDSDIYENNRGGFEEPSDNDANFSFDTQRDANASVSDDFLDTFDSDTSYSDSNINPKSGILGAGQEGYQQQAASAEQQAYQEQPPVQGPREQKKSSGLVYIILLGLLFIAAVGMFFYKKNSEQSALPPENQEMGDYFYDKAAEGDKASTAPSSSQQNENMATVDVDLTTVADKTDTASNAPAAQKQKTEEAAKDKPMNAIEKALAKKKADEAKENQIGLKTTTSSVVIPVSSGGRPDPFLPYGAQVASTAAKPKFDIVAPPLEIPETDPMIEKLMDFKITGIMFDNIRPSAILIVDGNEQLVHKGDSVMGYKILNITKNKVVVKYKTNVYEVSAGETLRPEGVNLNPVSSLSKQFGGAYSNTPKNIIQFN